MAKTILQGTAKGARKRGKQKQKKRWEDNIKDWPGMGFGDSLRAAEDREGWKGIVATSSGYSPLNMHEHSPRLFRGEYSLYIRAKLTSAVNHHDSYIGFRCVY